jgi:CRISPR-associated protein Csd2
MAKSSETTQAIQNRYDFIYLFDVTDGNPNGDPDQGNLPRIDPETNYGLVTDVCIKRKVRNYIEVNRKDTTNYEIFIKQGNILNDTIEAAKGAKPEDRQKSLCEGYFDIRTFGAVMSTGDKGAGTVRGPVQFTFGRSIDRIFQAEHAITRLAVTTKEEAKKQEKREHASTMGRKYTVPYGLYLMKGFISASDAQKTGFSETDLALLWESLQNAFEHDRSAARGEMVARKIIIFKHDSPLGNARSADLFSRVIIGKNSDVEIPRAFSDYTVTIDKAKLPQGIELIEK